MKKHIFTITLAFMFLTCYGCAETPGEVLEDMSSYHDIQADDRLNQSEFTMLPITQLNDDIENALHQKYGQYNFTDSVSVSAPETVNIMTFQIMDDFETNYMEAFSSILTQEELARQDIVYQDHTPVYTANGHTYQGKYATYGYEFTNDSEQTLGIVNNLGHICVIQSSAYDSPFETDDETVQIYHVDREDDLSDSYALADGVISVSDAVAYINQWLESSVNQFEPDFSHKVKTVVVKRKADICHFEITVEKYYQGAALNSYATALETDEDTERSYLRYVTSECNVYMYHVNDIDCFTTGGHMLNVTAAEPISEYVSLDSALRHCQVTFTDFQDMTISDINIIYTLSPVYDYIGEEITEDDGTKLNLSQPFPSAGVILNSRPVWEFVIDVAPESYLQEGEINTYGDVHKYIYVDMLTGELFYQLETEL